ncbi:MAG: FHA domain-containing protein [Myxococcales bacterium]|nr:FHA domain-containing protein [Myxococcales bacterium]
MADTVIHDLVCLRVQDGAGGEEVERILGPIVSVGRGVGNDVALRDARVSALHGRLVVEGGRVFFQDLGSTNGSALIRDGARRALPREGDERTELFPGDELLLGDADHPSRLRLLRLSAGAATRPCSETVLARRALGDGAGAGARERFSELLQLLSSLRAEEDIAAAAGRVVGYLERVLGRPEVAECLLWEEGDGPTRLFPPGEPVSRGDRSRRRCVRCGTGPRRCCWRRPPVNHGAASSSWPRSCAAGNSPAPSA